MRITVKLFGAQSQAAGRDELEVDAPGDQPVSCAVLRERLARAEPALAPSLGCCRFAVNHEFAQDDRRIAEGDEVALIGLVSGG